MTIITDIFVNEVPWAIPMFGILVVLGLAGMILAAVWERRKPRELVNTIWWSGVGAVSVGILAGSIGAYHVAPDTDKLREDLSSAGISQVDFTEGQSYKQFLSVKNGGLAQCVLFETDDDTKYILECSEQLIGPAGPDGEGG